MIDPSRARRIFAGAAASVFAVAAATGMAAGVTAVTAGGVSAAGPAPARLAIRADSKGTPRCFALRPIQASSASPGHSHHVRYVLTAERRPASVRPKCFHT